MSFPKRTSSHPEHSYWAGLPEHHVFGLGQPRTHLVHVVRHDGPAWQTQIRFRDALRADAELRRSYEELKYRLANQFQEARAEYTAAKSPFLEQVLARPRQLRDLQGVVPANLAAATHQHAAS